MYKFVKFMFDTCVNESIDHIAFSARDGYTLIKAFEVINNANVSTSYVYAPRIFSYAYNSVAELDTYNLAGLKYIAKYFYDVLQVDASDMTKEEIVQLIRDNQDALTEENNRRMKTYAAYLRAKIGGNKNYIFMDITTGRFTC